MIAELMQMMCEAVSKKSRRIQDQGPRALESYVDAVLSNAKGAVGVQNAPDYDLNQIRMLNEIARENAIAELLKE